MEKNIVEGNKTWGDVVREFKPGATDDEVNYILWNESAYPFAPYETIMKQIKTFLEGTTE